MNAHFKDEEAETLLEKLHNVPKVRRLCPAGKQLVWVSHWVRRAAGLGPPDCSGHPLGLWNQDGFLQR